MTKTKRLRDSLSFAETAKSLGITVRKLDRICQFFDQDKEDEWELIEEEHFEYEPGQAGKRRFYEEGAMAIAKYLEETEGGNILARIYEFFTRHRASERRAQVNQLIVQVTQDRGSVEIRGDLIFLEQRSVIRVLGTNGKGIAGAIRRIDQESADLEGAEGLEVGVHFDSFEGRDQRCWSQRGIARLARSMYEKGRITKPRKAWVKAVADVAEPCLEGTRKQLESYESRVRTAKEQARRKAMGPRGPGCAVTGKKPSPVDEHPITLEAHHLFDASSRPDLAAYADNLLVIEASIHRNFHKWMKGRPCEPQDFIDYLLTHELSRFDGPPRSKQRQEMRLQRLMRRLELLQSNFEGHRLYD